MSRVRGWCPSAHRPMVSGDGLLVRVKPRIGRLSDSDMKTIGLLSDSYGNGVIDLTSRGNLQIRGVAKADHPALLADLIAVGLVDAEPAREERRNITVSPLWQSGDRTERLYHAIEARLGDLPDLPGKMGVVIDAGPSPVLTGVSGDFRFESALDGQLILRADGAGRGMAVIEADAVDALCEMARWFVATGGPEAGRMARHLERVDLPAEWRGDGAARAGARPEPGGAVYGVPFGRATAADLTKLVSDTGARHVRVSPWRMLFLEGAAGVEVEGFLSSADPVLDVAACPGAPACAQGQVETRGIARALAGRVGTLHVSGCAKGCARQAISEVTLVGRAGRFDLVRNGRAGDMPERSGLTDAQVLELFA